MNKKNILSKAAILAVASTTVSHAEIKLADDLNLSGYLDLAVFNVPGEDSLEDKVAELETVLSFTPQESPFSAVAELSFRGSEDTSEVDVNFETVTITYSVSDALSFSVGNILSYQGLETFDATGLFQFSYAGVYGAPLYSAGYAFGASIDYFTDSYGLGAWIGEGAEEKVSVELLAQYTGMEGLTLKAIYANDPTYETINVWGTYAVGDFTFGAEFVETDYTVESGNADLTAFFVLANYTYNDFALTLRYTDQEEGGVDGTKFTVSPSYVFSDNLLGLVEVSMVEDDNGLDQTELAAELLFTF